jgi:hypothetical protein
MRVKLCSRCPYAPRDLAGHYDPEGIIHVCAMCDGQQASTNHYPRKDYRRQKCATVPNIFATAQPSAARSVKDSLASSGIIPGEPASVQRSALTASGSGRRPTADGYVGFKPPPDNGCGEHHAATSRSSQFRSKEAAQ